MNPDRFGWIQVVRTEVGDVLCSVIPILPHGTSGSWEWVGCGRWQWCSTTFNPIHILSIACGDGSGNGVVDEMVQDAGSSLPDHSGRICGLIL